MEEDVNLKFDGYDEDLNENSFFKYIQTKQKALYDKVAKQRWIVCVPRKGTLSRSNHTVDDVENHFLQPIETDGSPGYRTLNHKTVKVNEGFILTEKGFEDVKYVRILFEETYFNSNNESFQVLCLDQPLEGRIGVSADPVVQALDNLQGCIDFLWPSTGTKQGQKQIDDIIRLFNSTYQQLEGESLRHLMDAANTIYTRAMQAALINSQLRKLSLRNKSYLDNIKLAIETYVIHGLYNQLMKGISCIVGNEDAALNKITRNLAEIQIKDLGIKAEICVNLPRGRRILSFLNRYTSPLEKFHCLKRSITVITERKMKEKEPGTVNAITADDLLPALVFLVIKSDIPNWLTNITFLHNFHFSKCGYNEFQFYLSSLEAAVEHVRSGYVSSEFKGGSPFKRLQNGVPGSSSLWQPVDHDSTKPTALDMLFEYAAQGKDKEVEKLLSNEEKEHVRLDKMCHPLCSCDKCEKLLSKRRNDPSAVTVFSRDDMGRTVLHVAAEYGHANLAYSLIHKGALVNTMDYHGSTPLHMACLRGHGKVVLILLHYKADANCADNDGNTPMHLCAANGHDQCCKSLVYSDMNFGILKVNVANENGDTPLHLAARWGYVDLVDLLIERGASIEARNKNKKTPLDCAHNQQVSEIILDAAAAHIEKETGFLGFLPEQIDKHGLSSSSRNLGPSLKGSVRSSLAGSPASSLERQSPKEVDVFLRTVADGDIEMVRFRLSLDEEDEEDSSDIQSEQDLCHPLCQCDKCIKWQKLTQRSLACKVHVNCSNQDGVTPLHVAAVRGYTAIANLLLRHGADPSAKDNSKQQTPLHLSCQYNHPEVTELLLNCYAKINAKDYKGNTPLHFCCLNGHLATALVLLERTVNVDAQNDRGNTPLHEAARWNFCELVRVLLQHGACVTLCNKIHLTPVQYAKHDDVVKVFEQSERIANESSLTRRKTWAGISSASNQNHVVSLPNPVESQGTSPTSNTLRDHHKGVTAGPRVSYCPSTKTVQMEDHPRHRSLSENSICDTTIERPQTKLNSIFEQLEYGEVEKLQEIAKAVRAFDRKKSLKRTNTIDKSSPFFAMKPDRQILEVLDQYALHNDPLFDQSQRIVPPNNTPAEKVPPSSSSPLLDRVRRVLQDDGAAVVGRPSQGPLLDRVRNIVIQEPSQGIRPSNHPRCESSSSSDEFNSISGGNGGGRDVSGTFRFSVGSEERGTSRTSVGSEERGASGIAVDSEERGASGVSVGSVERGTSRSSVGSEERGASGTAVCSEERGASGVSVGSGKRGTSRISVGSDEEGAVLESMHPELVAIVESEINNLDQTEKSFRIKTPGHNTAAVSSSKELHLGETDSLREYQSSTCKTNENSGSKMTCHSTGADVDLVQGEEIKYDQIMDEAENVLHGNEVKSNRSFEQDIIKSVNIDLPVSSSTEMDQPVKSESEVNNLPKGTSQICEDMNLNRDAISVDFRPTQNIEEPSLSNECTVSAEAGDSPSDKSRTPIEQCQSVVDQASSPNECIGKAKGDDSQIEPRHSTHDTNQRPDVALKRCQDVDSIQCVSVETQDSTVESLVETHDPTETQDPTVESLVETQDPTLESLVETHDPTPESLVETHDPTETQDPSVERLVETHDPTETQDSTVEGLVETQDPTVERLVETHDPTETQDPTVEILQPHSVLESNMSPTVHDESGYERRCEEMICNESDNKPAEQDSNVEENTGNVAEQSCDGRGQLDDDGQDDDVDSDDDDENGYEGDDDNYDEDDYIGDDNDDDDDDEDEETGQVLEISTPAYRKGHGT